MKGQTMSKLKELLEEIEPVMRQAFDKFGEITKPVWFCEDDEGQKGMIFTEVDDVRDKDTLAEFIKNEFKERNVVRYVTVMEMWFVSTNEEGYKQNNLPPAQRDDRKEGVMFHGEDRDTGEKVFKVFEINRSSGKPVLNTEGVIKDFDMAAGRFVDLFHKPTMN